VRTGLSGNRAEWDSTAARISGQQRSDQSEISLARATSAPHWDSAIPPKHHNISAGASSAHPSHICAGTRLAPSHICAGTWAHPIPQLRRDLGSPHPTSAPGPGLTPSHSCAGAKRFGSDAYLSVGLGPKRLIGGLQRVRVAHGAAARRRGLNLALQRSTTRCNAVQHAATQYNMLQRSTTRCNAAQHVATQYNTLQRSTMRCNAVQHVATQYDASRTELRRDAAA
jgi:hypothetical protein